MNNIIQEEIRDISKRISYLDMEISDLEYDRDMSLEYVKYLKETGRIGDIYEDEIEGCEKAIEKATNQIIKYKFMRGEYVYLLNKLDNCYSTPSCRRLEDRYSQQLIVA